MKRGAERFMMRAGRTFACRAIALLAACLLAGLGGVASAQVAPSEWTSPVQWQPLHVPFSFRLAGRPSRELLPMWRVSQGSQGLATGYSYTDPASGLTVTAEVRGFPDFPGAVDWVLRFRNDGSADSPMLEDILPLDLGVAGAGEDDAIVRHARGSLAKAQDFAPVDEPVGEGESRFIASASGDSSSGESLPFFNLQTGTRGLVEAIGWTGNWRAGFVSSEDGKTLTLTAGMKKTHLVLHPGEEIRTPRIVLMRWQGGNWQDAQNAWRRLLLAHYTPQEHGEAMRGPISFGSWGSEAIAAKLAYIDWVHKNQIPVTLYAVDAGWYGASVGAESDPTNPWWKNRGDWYPSPKYYPAGIKPLGDALRQAGLGFSLWLEPETSMAARQIIREHPGWFLHTDKPMFTEGFSSPDVSLANLANPAARAGITRLVSGFIRDYGMTWYRQDFNIPPERYWELADAPDRVGMTEIRHIEGLYEMWDTLLAEHPGLRIDNCASGGRRVDIEMLSRSFLIWRTDHGFADTVAEQAQTQALAYWVPENMGFESYTTTRPWEKPGPYSTPRSLYLMRLGYDAGYGVTPGAAGVKNDAWVTWIKQALGEYREVQPYFYGDFYPLLSYSLAADSWTAWQWDRPGKQDGVVMVMRRPESPFTTMELGLKHLDLKAMYGVEMRRGLDHARVQKMSGEALAHLSLQLPEAPSSVLIFYAKWKDHGAR